MYVILAILIFGFLIATHELGHFLAAKLFKVRVDEFSIGMGPAIFKKQGKQTLYALRALPLGGYCAMGEDEESMEKNAFSNQTWWKKAIILISGAFMNFLTGFIILLFIVSNNLNFSKAEIVSFYENCPYEQSQSQEGFMDGDTFYKIDGQRVYFHSNVSMLLGRNESKVYDIVVLRDGEKVQLNDFKLTLVEYEENGVIEQKYGFYFGKMEEGLGATLKNAWYASLDFVRMVIFGLGDLISGRVGVSQMSGMVGIVGLISDVGTSASTVSLAISSIAYLSAFIAINLAVMNMLPIPALDGGRIFFLIVTAGIEKITKKKLNPKYEGYVHTVGFVLLLGLMVFLIFNDVIKLFS